VFRLIPPLHNGLTTYCYKIGWVVFLSY